MAARAAIKLKLHRRADFNSIPVRRKLLAEARTENITLRDASAWDGAHRIAFQSSVFQSDANRLLFDASAPQSGAGGERWSQCDQIVTVVALSFAGVFFPLSLQRKVNSVSATEGRRNF